MGAIGKTNRNGRPCPEQCHNKVRADADGQRNPGLCHANEGCKYRKSAEYWPQRVLQLRERRQWEGGRCHHLSDKIDHRNVPAVNPPIGIVPHRVIVLKTRRGPAGRVRGQPKHPGQNCETHSRDHKRSIPPPKRDADSCCCNWRSNQTAEYWCASARPSMKLSRFPAADAMTWRRSSIHKGPITSSPKKWFRERLRCKVQKR